MHVAAGDRAPGIEKNLRLRYQPDPRVIPPVILAAGALLLAGWGPPPAQWLALAATVALLGWLSAYRLTCRSAYEMICR